jgi:acyl-CoA hydrolase
MPEDSVTVMILPEDDTETILEKVRQAGAKKVSLIVPPGTRSLQTLGGFTMLRKACDITEIEVTVYSEDEKTRDMATVCRFDVVSLDQDVRPRPTPPPEEEPRIVVSTRPPAPGGPSAEPAAAAPSEARARAADELSADDLALFDALESMSLDEDIELRSEDLHRPAPAAAPPSERPAPAPRPERPAKKKAKKASPFRVILDPLANAVASIYIAVVSLFLRIAQRSMQKEAPESEEAPTRLAPQAQSDEEKRTLRMRKLRYSLWALAGVVGATILVIGIYALSQPKVFVTLTPREAETREMDLTLSIVLTDTAPSGNGVNAEGAIVAQQVQVELTGTASLPASGLTTIPEGTSTGAVIFVNVTGYAVNVPAGTRVTVPGGGIIFHTTQDVWLPGSDFRGPDAYLGKAQVNIVADTPGSAGNVAASAISVIEGDLSGMLTVENAEPTSGGSERQTSVVTAEDHEKLHQQLVEGLQTQAYNQLQAQLSGLQVLSGTLEVETLEETFDYGVGSEATIVTLNARVRAAALASAPGALNTAVEQAVADEFAPQQGQALGKLQTSAIEAAPGTGINTWTYRTHVRVPIVNTITAQLKSEVRASLRGKPYADAGKVMAKYQDRIAAFAISPVVGRLPSIGGIEVVDSTAIK